MPGMVATVVQINDLLCGPDFDAAQVRELLVDGNLSLLDAVDKLGAIDALEPGQRNDMRAFVSSMPAACAAAAFAAVRSALERDLPVQLTWQPAAAFEVRVWDVSDENRGMVNVFVLSPDPEA